MHDFREVHESIARKTWGTLHLYYYPDFLQTWDSIYGGKCPWLSVKNPFEHSPSDNFVNGGQHCH